MNKVVVTVILATLLTCGADGFKVSDKDYVRIEELLEFGAQLVLNGLENARKVIQRLVEDNQLRSNRVEFQRHWNSFKETAHKISVEERGKGVKDDLIVAVRTFRRLVSFYQEDIKNIFRAVTSQQSFQQYLPVLKMVEGIVKKDKVNEVWGSMESYYFPGAPSLNTDPTEFLCYLLSTDNLSTFILNTLRLSTDVVSEIQKIDFEEVQNWVVKTWLEVLFMGTHFQELETEKEGKDKFLESVSAATRVILFCWDKFLNYTGSPDFKDKVTNVERSLRTYDSMMNDVDAILQPLIRSDFIADAMRLNSEYFDDLYDLMFSVTFGAPNWIGQERSHKTGSAMYGVSLCALEPIFKKLNEMKVFSKIRKLQSRAMDIGHALLGGEEMDEFRTIVFDHWNAFRDEAQRVLHQEKANATILLEPAVRSTLRLMSNYSKQVSRAMGGSDEKAEHILKNLEQMKTVCTDKLVFSGAVTQNELDESQRVYREGFPEVLEFLKMENENEIHDIVWSLYKVTLVLLNYAYEPLTEAWNFIST